MLLSVRVNIINEYQDIKQATFGALRFLCCKYVNINKAKKYSAALSWQNIMCV